MNNSPETQKLSLKEKIGWGSGGFSDQFATNGLNNIFVPVFNIGLGLNSVLIGWAISIPRFVDMATDPLMGNISDNCRSRFGRRRPFILIGSILMAFAFVLCYMVSPYWSGGVLFAYAIITCIFFYLMHTIFAVPYTALGLELAEDYDDRADLQKYRMLFSSLAIFMIPWLYKMCIMAGEHVRGVVQSAKSIWYAPLLEPVAAFAMDGNVKVEVLGARYVAWIVAAVIILTALPAFLFTREKHIVRNAPKIHMFASGKLVMKNHSFRTLCGMIFLVIIGMYFMGVLVTYANIFYIFDGDKSTAATWGGLYGTVSGVIGVLGSFIVPLLVRRLDKKKVLMGGLVMSATAILGSWFLLNPAYPALQLVLSVAVGIGMSACWLLNGAFIADICDEDELLNGYRREGMFAAFFGFIVKMAFSGIALLLGVVLWLIGYESGADVMSPETILRMRVFIAFFPSSCLLGAFWVFWRYSLSRSRLDEIQGRLRLLREQENSNTSTL